MFSKLFAESGLSLDRLKAMLEVGAAGSIVRAAEGDPVRQSQYSRQIKELEDFFRVKLMERHGKGMQLTSNGKELARISRFFLLGLSNFQRGCLAEGQQFRIGASATFLQTFLVPVVCESISIGSNRFFFEVTGDDEIERRLHDLTLDFGIVTKTALSRPLQLRRIGSSGMKIHVPKRMYGSRAAAAKAFREKSLPLAVAGGELDKITGDALRDYGPRVVCDSFLSARAAMENAHLAAVLPDFLASAESAKSFWRIDLAPAGSGKVHFHLAWNPRLIRLNPHVARTRDFLIESLDAMLKAVGCGK